MFNVHHVRESNTLSGGAPSYFDIGAVVRAVATPPTDLVNTLEKVTSPKFSIRVLGSVFLSRRQKFPAKHLSPPVNSAAQLLSTADARLWSREEVAQSATGSGVNCG